MDAVNAKQGYLTALGQQVTAPADLLGAVRQGDYIAVIGTVARSGAIEATLVLRDSASYVPGASSVYVSASAAITDARYGKAEVGALVIDYTAMLWEQDALTGISGFVGTQPSGSGLMLATGSR